MGYCNYYFFFDQLAVVISISYVQTTYKKFNSYIYMLMTFNHPT